MKHKQVNLKGNQALIPENKIVKKKIHVFPRWIEDKTR